MGGTPGDISEDPVTLEMLNMCRRMNCHIGEAKEGLKNEL